MSDWAPLRNITGMPLVSTDFRRNSSALNPFVMGIWTSMIYQAGPVSTGQVECHLAVMPGDDSVSFIPHILFEEATMSGSSSISESCQSCRYAPHLIRYNGYRNRFKAKNTPKSTSHDLPIRALEIIDDSDIIESMKREFFISMHLAKPVCRWSKTTYAGRVLSDLEN